MGRKQRKLLSEEFQSNSYKLLYFIYSNSEIKATPGIKSKLKSTFGYSSDSSFYNDWDFFKKNQLIEEDDKSIRITRLGKREFRPLTTLRWATVISFFSGLFFLASYLNTLKSSVPIVDHDLVASVILLLVALGNYWAYHFYGPQVPEGADDLL